jgi:hypothetical protein
MRKRHATSHKIQQKLRFRTFFFFRKNTNILKTDETCKTVLKETGIIGYNRLKKFKQFVERSDSDSVSHMEQQQNRITNHADQT